MKPLKLKMKAFGTFKNEIIIDFEKVGQNGLFLITGDTGAGKTTIFDAIIYAIYGEVSGSTRPNKENLVSDFANDSEESFVELEFSHKGENYYIKRNPKQMIRKLRGEGFKTINSQVILKENDEEPKIGKEATEKINDIIGISANQFKQVAMLAQGEFLSLLISDNDKRSEILRKIFNTGIYLNAELKLKFKLDKLSEECRNSDNFVVERLKAIEIYKDDINFEEIKEWKNNGSKIAGVETVLEYLKEIINTDEEKFKQVENKKKKYEKIVIKLEKEIDEINQINQKFQRLDNLQNQQIEISVKQDEINQDTKRYNDGLRAKNITQYVKSFEREQQVVIENEKFIEDYYYKLKENEKNLKISKIEFEENQKNKPEIESLSEIIAKEKDNIDKYDEIKNLEIDAEEINNKIQDNKNLITEIQLEIKNISEEMQNNNILLENLKDTDVNLVKVKNKIDELENKKPDFREIDNDIKNIRVKIKEYNDKRNEFLIVDSNFKKLNIEYENKKSLFLMGQAGIMAESLKNTDIPCPVCGSKSHPKLASKIENTPTEKELKEFENTKNTEDTKRQSLSNELGIIKAKIDTSMKDMFKKAKKLLDFDGQNANDLKICKHRLNEKANQINDEIIMLKDEEDKLETDSKNKISLESRKVEIENQIKADTNKLEDIKNQNNDDEKKVTSILSQIKMLKNSLVFATKDEAVKNLKSNEEKKILLENKLNISEKNYNDEIKKNQSIKEILTEKEKELEKNRAMFNKAQNDLNDNLQKFEFLSKNEYQQALIDDDQEIYLKNKIEEYNKLKLENDIAIKHIKNELDGKSIPNLDEIKEKFNNAITNKRENEKEFITILNKNKNNTSIYKDVQKKWNEQESVRNQFLMVGELYRTMSGKLSGKGKISFEEYIQSFYFKKIIQQANKRLEKMTESRYELQRKSMPVNNRDRFALELEVFDYYTGKARDIRTLSGGESFKAALSLALGLSDVIQSEAGGIEIDAVFIDEGFGTLDAESLEQAINILLDLTEGNRLVGIISHVNELKEKIDRKIVVKKSIDGSSVEIL